MSNRTKRSRTDCSCPINFVQDMVGEFNLICGSEPFKIFDSDVPTEIFISIEQRELIFSNENLCELQVTIELDDGSFIVETIPNPNASAQAYESVGKQFYSKMIRRITIQCEGGEDGTQCSGNWQLQIFLRGSNKYPSCECPVFFNQNQFGSSLPSTGNFLTLSCGSEEFTMFESNEPLEVIGQVVLRELFSANRNVCELEITVELQDGSSIEFILPNPNTIPTREQQNTISYHFQDTKRITLKCLSGEGNGCPINYQNYFVMRS
ncbi:hypothetical protein [Bacillus sp. FJAT-49736]|uniref:hypothetical protein n=1 Tax=Bacillus sp. FJAT-49736 TaxID=2833582 RepID=UPI001BCA4D7A|nr:hypothetical protein [Bacillus sp. FJAT-49736]MBS4171672.1 hypothetical protein [Bacillus sp. FJAT-49736]